MGPIGRTGLMWLIPLLPARVLAADVAWDTIIRLTTNPSSQVTGYTGQRSVAAYGAQRT